MIVRFLRSEELCACASLSISGSSEEGHGLVKEFAVWGSGGAKKDHQHPPSLLASSETNTAGNHHGYLTQTRHSSVDKLQFEAPFEKMKLFKRVIVPDMN